MKMTFIKAEWKKLLMINYVVDKDILLPYLPKGTEFDLYNDKCYVSIVGFESLNTKFLGIKWPLHGDFEEINLRFYVRHNDNGVIKHGVVFIREIVYSPITAYFARKLFNQKYVASEMRHVNDPELVSQILRYEWKRNKFNKFRAEGSLALRAVEVESQTEFFTERHWSYTKTLNRKKTSEMYLEHPRWEDSKVYSYKVKVDFGKTFGKSFEILNTAEPASVLLVEGSEIELKNRRLF
jgi:hypothetical protein